MFTMRRMVGSLAVVGLCLTGCSDGSSTPAETTTTSTAPVVKEITREVLAAGQPTSAPGQELSLQKVTIPAGERLTPHTHPGMQLAQVVEGTLTYEIIRGTVEIHRKGQKDAEFVAGPKTVRITAGDWLIETPALEHTGANKGKVPVVIYLSSLFPVGAAPSTPLTPSTTTP